MGKVDILNMLSEALSSLIERASRSVVTVVSSPFKPEIVFNPVEARGVGTGFAVTEKLIVTALHVIEESSEVTVLTVDGRAYSAARVAEDPYNDLALLELREDSLTPLPLNTSTPRVGSVVLVLGTYLGRPWISAYLGIVSGLHRHVEMKGRVVEDLIQVDTSVATGTSGGPVVSSDGSGVAMVVAVSAGATFAVPARSIYSFLKFYRKFGRGVRPFIGVQTAELTAGYAKLFGVPFHGKGVVVLRVIENSPAKRAGLKPGDVILRAGGRIVHRLDDLRSYVEEAVMGNRVVELDVWRQGEVLRVTLEVLLES